LRAAATFLGPPPALDDLRYLLLDRGEEITAAFYERITASVDTASFIEDAAKLERLHHSLLEWLRAFLSSPPEANERAELALRMTVAHLRIGMPLELTMLGHNALRGIMTRELMERWPVGDRLGLIDASERLQRAFDYDLLLLVSCYHAEALGRAAAASQGLKRANERLEQSMQAQEGLLRTTSHELRTPLAGLVGMLRMLKRGVYDEGPERTEALDDALGAANHLQALTDDLLHLARLDLGSDRFCLEDFDLRAASEVVLRRLNPRAEEGQVQFSLEGEEASVHADRERHAQILTNLLQNAIRHSPGGHIRVGIQELEESGHVLTEVVDDGCGIDPKLLPSLFQPFTQSSGGGSLGLGLTICRRLVLAMGGRIVAESEGSGKGARFAFTLPTGGRHAGAHFVEGPDDASARMLLVDDDAVWSHDLADFLTSELPLQVTAVSTADAALQAVTQTRFDLILLDVALPSTGEGRDRDGLSLLEELARHPDTLLARKWLVSGHDASFLRTELEHAWHDRFLTKADLLADRPAFVAQVRAALPQLGS
jgi:signal transduction histidine kinase/CheY-like chemotaxis protein